METDVRTCRRLESNPSHTTACLRSIRPGCVTLEVSRPTRPGGRALGIARGGHASYDPSGSMHLQTMHQAVHRGLSETSTSMLAAIPIFRHLPSDIRRIVEDALQLPSIGLGTLIAHVEAKEIKYGF